MRVSNDFLVFQAQTERKREQEAQMLEKQRLEEILTMCAEYERQTQNERHVKPPTTPTLQQNRLVTASKESGSVVCDLSSFLGFYALNANLTSTSVRNLQPDFLNFFIQSVPFRFFSVYFYSFLVRFMLSEVCFFRNTEFDFFSL